MMDVRTAVLDGVCKCCHPRKIILYGEKVTADRHALKSADFCIVLDEFNQQKLLKELYLSIETEIPVQFMLYRTDEWNTLTRNPNSYASAIRRKGTVLYGEET